MTPVFERVVVGFVLAPYIGLSAMVAPEHAHAADADHPHAAVHRHLQPHGAASHDHDHAQLADDDGHIVWLDGVALYEAPYQFSALALLPPQHFELVPAVADWTTPPDYDAAPPHGPPKSDLSLRAPPPLV